MDALWHGSLPFGSSFAVFDTEASERCKGAVSQGRRLIMRELLRNAWLGWQNYTDDGKLAALLLAALLFLWLRNKKVSQKGF